MRLCAPSDSDNDFTNLRLVKRGAPVGFLGMRGKKATPNTRRPYDDGNDVAMAHSYGDNLAAAAADVSWAALCCGTCIMIVFYFIHESFRSQKSPTQNDAPTYAADYQDDDYYTANVLEKRGPVGFLGM